MEIGKSVRVTELSRIAKISKSAVTQGLKSEFNLRGRIIGVEPETVEKFLSRRGLQELYKSAFFVITTQTGGAGKTSTTYNLALACRRLMGRDKAVIMVDADSQASLTKYIFGEEASQETNVLNTFIEGKCSAIDLLKDTGDNMFVIPSNLLNLYNDRALSDVVKLKKTMSNLITDLFKHFGTGTKIFVDTPPQLSSVGQSFVLAATNIKNGYLLIPVRPDSFGIRGAEICIQESLSTVEAFNISPTKLNAHCFLSAHNGKTTASMKTLSEILKNEFLSSFLSPVMIRFSNELPNSTFKKGGMFSETKNIKTVGSDYTDLLLTTLGWEAPE